MEKRIEKIPFVRDFLREAEVRKLKSDPRKKIDRRQIRKQPHESAITKLK